MDFELNEDQQMLANLFGDFASKESPVERFRKLRDSEQGWENSLWSSIAELGLLGVPFTEEDGGFGGSFVELASICEHLGKSLMPEPYVASVVLAGGAISRAGSAEQKQRYLGPLIAGEQSLAWAHAERGNRFAPDQLATRATVKDGGFTLEGEKVFVDNGHAADHLVVSASLGTGLGLFVVPADAEGLERVAIQMMDGRRGAHLKLSGVALPATAALLGGDDASAVVEAILDLGAAATVAEGLGVCQTMLDMTVEYLKTREQFGVKIGVFQALQHRSVDMFVEMALLRSISIKAIALADSADARERSQAISEAKIQLSTAGKYIARQAVQLHGGIGVTDEHDVGLYFKRMHALFTLFGDEDYHLERLACLNGVS